jgi:hypothetical protein
MHAHPHCIFLGFSTQGSHSDFVGIKYTTKGPTGKSIACSITFALFTYPTCVFPLLVDDTHMVGPTCMWFLVFYDYNMNF